MSDGDSWDSPAVNDGPRYTLAPRDGINGGINGGILQITTPQPERQPDPEEAPQEQPPVVAPTFRLLRRGDGGGEQRSRGQDNAEPSSATPVAMTEEQREQEYMKQREKIFRQVDQPKHSPPSQKGSRSKVSRGSSGPVANPHILRSPSVLDTPVLNNFPPDNNNTYNVSHNSKSPYNNNKHVPSTSNRAYNSEFQRRPQPNPHTQARSYGYPNNPPNGAYDPEFDRDRYRPQQHHHPYPSHIPQQRHPYPNTGPGPLLPGMRIHPNDMHRYGGMHAPHHQPMGMYPDPGRGQVPQPRQHPSYDLDYQRGNERYFSQMPHEYMQPGQRQAHYQQQPGLGNYVAPVPRSYQSEFPALGGHGGKR